MSDNDSHDQDEARRRVQTKHAAVSGRLGPGFELLLPEGFASVNDWIEFDPDGFYMWLKGVSVGSVTEPMVVKVRKGGAKGGRGRAAKLNTEVRLNFLDKFLEPYWAKLGERGKAKQTADHIQRIEIRAALRRAKEAKSLWVPALEYWAGKSPGRFYRAVLDLKKSHVT